MNDDNVTPEVKINILQQKITFWQNSHYSASLDARVAQTIGDERMLEQAKSDMKRTLQAQDELKKIMDELTPSCQG